VRNSLAAEKKAGNFADSTVFFENQSRKHLQIQSFVREFPTQPSREFIRASREFIPPVRPAQGIWRQIRFLPAVSRSSAACFWLLLAEIGVRVDRKWNSGFRMSVEPKQTFVGGGLGSGRFRPERGPVAPFCIIHDFRRSGEHERFQSVTSCKRYLHK
jgi:hypothetical protein